MARSKDTYRGFIRNRQFGRNPRGNTKPHERREILARWLDHMLALKYGGRR